MTPPSDEQAAPAPPPKQNVGSDAPPPAHHRSSFPESVYDFGEIDFSAKVVGRNLFFALLAVLLIAFPAELFNKTVEENQDEIRGWFTRHTSLNKTPLRERFGSLPTFALFLAFAAFAAFLYGFLDPGFGADRASLALVIGLFMAIIVSTLAFEETVGMYSRAHGGSGYIRVLPAALVVAIPCILIARAVGFQPGYLYGVVAGFVLAKGELDRRQEGKSVLLGGTVMLTVALVAWLLWIPVGHAAADPDASMVTLVLDALLSGTFVAGLEGLLFVLIPLRFMDGDTLYRWNKAIWAAAFALMAFLVFQLIIRPGNDFTSTSTKTNWYTVWALFVGFGLFSIGFWAYFRFRSTSREGGGSAVESVDQRG